MPERAKRPCKQCGVSTGNRSGYCDADQKDNRQTRARQEFDKQRRENDPFRRLYNLALWKTIREAIRRRDPLCMICGIAASVIADHIIPARIWVAQGGSFWDKKNLQGLCKECHDRKTATEDSSFTGSH